MRPHLPSDTYRRLDRFATDFASLMCELRDQLDYAERAADARLSGWRGVAADEPAWRWDLSRMLTASHDLLAETARYLGNYPQLIPAPARAAREISVHLPKQTRSAVIGPSSFSAEDRSIEVVWTTGAGVTRYDFDGPYTETLDVTPAAVKLDRLNAGAPFLNTHSSRDLDDVIGSVVPGSARIQGGQGLARVKLSGDPVHAGIVGNIRDGVIRNVSVGYEVLKIVRTEGTDKTLPLMRVTSWRPIEISAVPIPADFGAQIRTA